MANSGDFRPLLIPSPNDPEMPYRAELRRPDLKGTFRCSICSKIFCHSSSLSRHRMQAHFKSYTCTLCNKEITSNETLRAHMFKLHQISRMFMCRCCNWAFPDKTSLHIHVQSMASSGSPGNISIIAKSSQEPPGSPTQSGAAGGSSIFPNMPSRDELIMRLRERAMMAGAQGLNFLPPELAAEAAKAAQFIKGEPTDEDGNNNSMQNFLARLMQQSSSAQRAEQLMRSDWSDQDHEDMMGSGDEGMDGEDSYIDVADDSHSTANESAPLNLSEIKRSGSGQLEESGRKKRKRSNPNHCDQYQSWKVKAEESAISPAASGDEAELNGDEKCEGSEGRGSVEMTKIPTSSPLNLMVNKNHSAMAPPRSTPTSTDQQSTGANSADLPILRSAISASPLSSLMYQKKLMNVLRKGPADAAAHGFLHGAPPLAGNSLLFGSGNGGQNGFGAAKFRNSLPFGFKPDHIDIHQMDGSQMISPTDQISHDATSGSSSNNGVSPTQSLSSASNSSTQPSPVGKGDCHQCKVLQGRLSMTENRSQFLEGKVATLESKVHRYQERTGTLEANTKRYETEGKLLSDHCELLERKIIQCQEKTLRMLQGDLTDTESVRQFLQHMLDTCRLIK